MFWPVTRLPAGGTGSIGGTAAVQQESTATGPDAGGPEWTWEDGDLRLYTRVDGLPLDGMQEVSGSSPLSSTFSQVRTTLGSWNRPPGTCRTRRRSKVWPTRACRAGVMAAELG